MLGKQVVDAISVANKDVEAGKSESKTVFGIVILCHPSLIVLVGKGGLGKSISLMQVADHFYNQKWLVVYIPRSKYFVG